MEKLSLKEPAAWNNNPQSLKGNFHQPVECEAITNPSLTHPGLQKANKKRFMKCVVKLVWTCHKPRLHALYTHFATVPFLFQLQFLQVSFVSNNEKYYFWSFKIINRNNLYFNVSHRENLEKKVYVEKKSQHLWLQNLVLHVPKCKKTKHDVTLCWLVLKVPESASFLYSKRKKIEEIDYFHMKAGFIERWKIFPNVEFFPLWSKHFSPFGKYFPHGKNFHYVRERISK